MKKKPFLILTILLMYVYPAGAFIDDFDTGHDFATDGVEGTVWDGLFGGSVVPADLIVKSLGGELILQSNGGFWNPPYDDESGEYGPYLYKEVTGDFLAITRVTAFAGQIDAQNFHNNAGIMARIPGGELTGIENLVQVAYFPTWTGHIVWNTIDSNREEIGFTVPIWVGDSYAATAQYPFLQLERAGDDFHFRISADGVNWIPLVQENVLYTGTETPVVRTRSDMPDTLQLGLMQSNAEMNTGFANFDFFAAGKIVAVISGTPVVKEMGQTTAEFSIQLLENNGPPDADVLVKVVPYALPDLSADPNTNDPNDIIVGDAIAPGYPATVVFPSGTWNSPQSVTVKAVDDLLKEGTEQIGLRLEVYSEDVDYDGQLGEALLVTVIDDDAAGVSIQATDGKTQVSESGGDDTVEISLAIAPQEDVTVTLSAAAGQLELSAAELVFTADNWDVPQPVTISAVDDSIVEKDPHTANVTITVSTSDLSYQGISVPVLVVSILENDCGAWSYLSMDRNQDCVVNLADFAEFAQLWLACTTPNDPACDDLR